MIKFQQYCGEKTMSTLNKINPIELGQRLQVARNTAGVTQASAAQTIGLSRPTIVAIENGKRRLKPHELIQLAELYEVSCNSLLRPNAVHVDIALQFRQNIVGYENNSDVLETEGILQKLASSYVELERILGKELRTFYPPEYPITKGNVHEQAEDLALEVRYHLGLGLAPISNIMTLLESELKIRVFIHKLPSNISGAFVYRPELGACIFINSKHPKTRQAMTAAHELGHFYTTRHIPQISWQDFQNDDKDHKVLAERFANRFAAAFLMPAPAIRRHYQETIRENEKFSPRSLIFLAHTFHVSLEAMVRRLENLSLFPKGTYESLRKRGLTQKTIQEVLGEQKQDIHTLSFPRYIYLAVEAYERDLVSEGQLVDMFELSRIEVREMIDNLTSLN
jgi:Zn-dependent peptidase ImmA (M78 family)/DNA-binding XRE family transcriptional regulator